MKDETYAFISDVKDKKITARSARHTRTHCGRGGRVRLPHDNLSKKELQKMSGECKSYRLNEPMAWKEFKAMPDDIKVTYIKLIQQKFNPPVTHIAKMMGVTEACVRSECKKLGLNSKRARGKNNEWDKEGFYAWANGVDKLPTPVPEEEPIQEPVITSEEPEAFVEDDLPFDIVPIEEPDPIPSFAPVQIPVTAIPTNGSMNFTCPAKHALNTLEQLLGETKVSISVMWRVVEEGAGVDGES